MFLTSTMGLLMPVATLFSWVTAALFVIAPEQGWSWSLGFCAAAGMLWGTMLVVSVVNLLIKKS